MASEKMLESRCVEHAKKRGWLAYKLKFEGTRGAPDRLFISNLGAIIFIEFKTEFGRVSDAQQLMHATLLSRKVPCFVCRSLSEFTKIIQAF